MSGRKRIQSRSIVGHQEPPGTTLFHTVKPVACRSKPDLPQKCERVLLNRLADSTACIRDLAEWATIESKGLARDLDQVHSH